MASAILTTNGILQQRQWLGSGPWTYMSASFTAMWKRISCLLLCWLLLGALQSACRPQVKQLHAGLHWPSSGWTLSQHPQHPQMRCQPHPRRSPRQMTVSDPVHPSDYFFLQYFLNFPQYLCLIFGLANPHHPVLPTSDALISPGSCVVEWQGTLLLFLTPFVYLCVIFSFSLPPLCALSEVTDQQSAGLTRTPPVSRAACDALEKHQQIWAVACSTSPCPGVNDVSCAELHHIANQREISPLQTEADSTKDNQAEAGEKGLGRKLLRLAKRLR